MAEAVHGDRVPLLLHSLAFYADLLSALASIPPNPNIVEIGSESGDVSVRLSLAAAARDGELFVIEPHPAAKLERFAREHSNVRVIADRSPAALRDLPDAGLYVVDGDHNYVTVKAELDHIFGRETCPNRLMVMHDVGWPCARRDFYYAPEALDKAAVHPHSFTRGAAPEQTELLPPGRGFRGEGQFAWALKEGGPRNGVRTALEDAAQELDLDVLITPLVFGLAIVGRAGDVIWPAVRDCAEPYLANPTLETMERNRIALYMQVLELQAELRARNRLRDVTRWAAGKAVAPVRRSLGRGRG